MAVNTDFGAFVPTTNIWDVSELYQIDVNSVQFKELLVRLYQNINNIALLLNVKDSGYYVLQEFVNSQLFFPNPSNNNNVQQDNTLAVRQVYRMVVNFGSLPNTTSKSVAHGIPFNQYFTVTRIYGASSDTTGLSYIPLPYASPVLANNIQLDISATNVTITTGSNRSNFNNTVVIIEYLKS